MGRELKRVPMDFDYPLGVVWYGFYNQYLNFCHSAPNDVAMCDSCIAYARIKGISVSIYEDGKTGCPIFEEYYEVPDLREKAAPPIGEGYQLWETTSEGSPASPVFETLDELCEWCETNATTFADFKTSKEKWKQMLEGDFVYHSMGNMLFI